MVTIGGWLTEKIGDIPKTGTKWERDGFLFQVLAATPTRIRRLYVEENQSKAANPSFFSGGPMNSSALLVAIFKLDFDHCAFFLFHAGNGLRVL